MRLKGYKSCLEIGEKTQLHWSHNTSKIATKFWKFGRPRSCFQNCRAT